MYSFPSSPTKLMVLGKSWTAERGRVFPPVTSESPNAIWSWMGKSLGGAKVEGEGKRAERSEDGGEGVGRDMVDKLKGGGWETVRAEREGEGEGWGRRAGRS